MKDAKVLIADDDRSIRKALKRRLGEWGYGVIECADGLDVIAHAVADDPAAMIIDHEMPNGDGCSVARMIRRESAAPIIFLSGHSRDTFRSIVTDLGDVYYLSKPLDDERLRSLLEACTRTNGKAAAPA